MLVACALFGAPAGSAMAHGGFEKNTGGVIVYITQTPLSPLVGEEVSVNFVLQKSDGLERLVGTPVVLKVVDTYYGDESRDQVVSTQTYKTDANGSFNFTYTFLKENYFDIDLSFTDPNNQEKLQTGFLIFPRTGRSAIQLQLPDYDFLLSPSRLMMVAGIFVVAMLTLSLSRRR